MLKYIVALTSAFIALIFFVTWLVTKRDIFAKIFLGCLAIFALVIVVFNTIKYILILP